MKNLLSKQQKQQLKQPCPVCQAKTQEVGDLGDIDHNIIMCSVPGCPFALMFDGYRMDLDK